MVTTTDIFLAHGQNTLLVGNGANVDASQMIPPRVDGSMAVPAEPWVYRSSENTMWIAAEFRRSNPRFNLNYQVLIPSKFA